MEIRSGDEAAAPAYDYRAHDRIWRRVSPSLTPFADAPGGMGAGVPRPEFLLPETEAPLPRPETETETARRLGALLREERANRRYERALAAKTGSAAVRTALRQLVAGAGNILRRLEALYLLAGGAHAPDDDGEPLRLPSAEEALRTCYFSEAGGGADCLRLGEGAADPSLQRLLKALGEEKLRRAETVLSLLEHRG